MVEQSGYEYTNEELINDLLKCSVCIKPLIDPVSTQCVTKPHIFCRLCIDESNTSMCPICQQNLSMEDLTPITGGIIREMLDQIPVNCLSCGQTELKRSHFDTHRRDVYVCPFQGVLNTER